MPVSKMLEEVWRWKEEAYQRTKDMTREELIAYYKGTLRRLEGKTGIKLNLPRAGRKRPTAGKRSPSK